MIIHLKAKGYDGQYSLAFLFVQNKYSLTLAAEYLWLAPQWYSSFLFFIFLFLLRTTLVFP